MGYWPSKLACILNVILEVGWGIIASIIAGQSMTLFRLTLSILELCFDMQNLLHSYIACFLHSPKSVS